GPSTRHTGKSADHSTELPTGHRLHVRSPGHSARTSPWSRVYGPICKCGGATGQPVRDDAGGVSARCAGVEPLAGTCGACRGPPGGRAVDGVPLSLTVVAGIGDRTLVANDLAVL